MILVRDMKLFCFLCDYTKLKLPDKIDTKE